MKAALMTATGESNVLELADIPTPVINAPDQVLVRLHAAGINPVDIKMREGFYNIKPLPFTLGWDGAGVVEAVGDKVTHVKPGDEVIVFYCSFGDRQGNYAEYVLATERNVTHKPKAFSFIEAASLPLSFLTAWESLFDRGHLQPGQSVLVHAGAGGVGQYAIQLAVANGITVYTTVGSQEKAEFVKSLGASEAILYKETDFAQAVNEFTNGAGVDATMDFVGGEIFAKSIPATRFFGQLVTLLKISPEVDLSPARMRNQSIGFELVLSPLLFNLEEHQLRQRNILDQASRLVAENKLKTYISSTYPLAKVREAHDEVAMGTSTGKVVLEIS
jgi:NADPH2:quinone reductase